MSAQTRIVIKCDKVIVVDGDASLALRRRGCPEEMIFAGLASTSVARARLFRLGWTHDARTDQDYCPKHDQ